MIDILIGCEPPFIKAQEVYRILLTPVSIDGSNEPVALEEVHTKDIHLIIVSEDFSFFSHEHPQKTDKGYTVDVLFPFGGKFYLYSDIKPVSALPVVIRKKVEVAGDQKVAQQYLNEVLSASIDEVSVRLDTSNPSAIKVHIHQNGAWVPASSLGDFLGAKAHVVVIPLESKAYLHVHPVVSQDKLVLHASFTCMGTYRTWVQILLEGKLYTFDFVLLVKGPPLHGHHH